MHFFPIKAYNLVKLNHNRSNFNYKQLHVHFFHWLFLCQIKNLQEARELPLDTSTCYNPLTRKKKTNNNRQSIGLKLSTLSDLLSN